MWSCSKPWQCFVIGWILLFSLLSIGHNSVSSGESDVDAKSGPKSGFLAESDPKSSVDAKSDPKSDVGAASDPKSGVDVESGPKSVVSVESVPNSDFLAKAGSKSNFLADSDPKSDVDVESGPNSDVVTEATPSAGFVESKEQLEDPLRELVNFGVLGDNRYFRLDWAESLPAIWICGKTANELGFLTKITAKDVNTCKHTFSYGTETVMMRWDLTVRRAFAINDVNEKRIPHTVDFDTNGLDQGVRLKFAENMVTLEKGSPQENFAVLKTSLLYGYGEFTHCINITAKRVQMEESAKLCEFRFQFDNSEYKILVTKNGKPITTEAPTTMTTVQPTTVESITSSASHQGPTQDINLGMADWLIACIVIGGILGLLLVIGIGVACFYCFCRPKERGRTQVTSGHQAHHAPDSNEVPPVEAGVNELSDVVVKKSSGQNGTSSEIESKAAEEEKMAKAEHFTDRKGMITAKEKPSKGPITGKALSDGQGPMTGKAPPAGKGLGTAKEKHGQGPMTGKAPPAGKGLGTAKEQHDKGPSTGKAPSDGKGLGTAKEKPKN